MESLKVPSLGVTPRHSDFDRNAKDAPRPSLNVLETRCSTRPITILLKGISTPYKASAFSIATDSMPSAGVKPNTWA
jgi:hypothetical protein